MTGIRMNSPVHFGGKHIDRIKARHSSIWTMLTEKLQNEDRIPRLPVALMLARQSIGRGELSQPVFPNSTMIYLNLGELVQAIADRAGTKNRRVPLAKLCQDMGLGSVTGQLTQTLKEIPGLGSLSFPKGVDANDPGNLGKASFKLSDVALWIDKELFLREKLQKTPTPKKRQAPAVKGAEA